MSNFSIKIAIIPAVFALSCNILLAQVRVEDSETQSRNPLAGWDVFGNDELGFLLNRLWDSESGLEKFREILRKGGIEVSEKASSKIQRDVDEQINEYADSSAILKEMEIAKIQVGKATGKSVPPERIGLFLVIDDTGRHIFTNCWIAEENRVLTIEDVPFTVEQYDQWTQWTDERDAKYANIKYEVLKKYLNREDFDRFLRMFVGDAGVNLLASPALRDQLRTTKSQNEELDRIYRSAHKLFWLKIKQWNALIESRAPRPLLDAVRVDTTEWLLSIEDELDDVLNSKQLERLKCWRENGKAGGALGIPAAYGDPSLTPHESN